MAITFTAAQTLLATLATRLSVEATAAGESDLSAKLSALSTEISTNNAMLETDFFGTKEAGETWSAMLDATSNFLAAKVLRSELPTIDNNISTIATNSTTVANMQTQIEAHVQRLRELGETTGIHIVGPYEEFSLATLYKFLIDEGGILENETPIDPALKPQAESYLRELMANLRPYNNWE